MHREVIDWPFSFFSRFGSASFCLPLPPDFSAPGGFPPPAAAALPIIVFTLSAAISRGFREYVLSLDVRTLTFLQAWRVIGFGFVIGGVYQILPNSFARPAGGRRARGLHCAARRALSLAAGSCASVCRVAASRNAGSGGRGDDGRARLRHLWTGWGGLTTRELFALPLIAIPTFGVPLVMIFHIICVWQVARRTAFTGVRDTGRAVETMLSPAR